MKWTDINDIAIELCDAHPDVDPMTVRFTELMQWVLALQEFDTAIAMGVPKMKAYKAGAQAAHLHIDAVRRHVRNR